MAKQGYDDTPYIEAVMAIMAADPDVSRRAAIVSVIGTNASNIRRIEGKMTRLARMPIPEVVPIQIVNVEPATAAAGKSTAHSGEAAFLVMGIVMITGFLAAWTWAPAVLVYPFYGMSWIQLKALDAIGLLSPAGRSALDHIGSTLMSMPDPLGIPLAEYTQTRAAVGRAFVPVSLFWIGICAFGSLAFHKIDRNARHSIWTLPDFSSPYGFWTGALFVVFFAVSMFPTIADIGLLTSVLIVARGISRRRSALPAPAVGSEAVGATVGR